MRCGAVTLDPRLARVTRDGVAVKLTSHEFRVLSYLMHHRTRVVSQSELTEHIYAQDFDRDSNTVEVFIARLRRKLGARSSRRSAVWAIASRHEATAFAAGPPSARRVLWTIGLVIMASAALITAMEFHPSRPHSPSSCTTSSGGRW